MSEPSPKNAQAPRPRTEPRQTAEPQQTAEALPPAEPLPPGERLPVLDAVRGLALLGILLVNLPHMALPEARAFAPYAGEPWTGELTWALVRVLAQSKFVALFAFLLGAGLALQTTRLAAHGAALGTVLRRRLAVLLVLGVLHGLLLFPGDVLLPYALVGGVLVGARRWRLGALLTTASLLFLVGLGFAFSNAAYESLSGEAWISPERGLAPVALDPAADVTWQSLLADDPALVEQAELHAHLRRSWPASLPFRATEWSLWLVFSTISSFNWRLAACAFLGVAAMRWRYLDRSRSLHLAVFWGGLAAGLVSQLLCVTLSFWYGFEPGREVFSRAILDEFGGLALSAGYLSGLVLFVRSGALAWLTRALVATGRMSLTNYLGQSLIGLLLFEGWALGWYGGLSRPAVLGLALAIGAVQLIASTLWLRTFRRGPAEWAWRRLTYGPGTAWRTEPATDHHTC